MRREGGLSATHRGRVGNVSLVVRHGRTDEPSSSWPWPTRKAASARAPRRRCCQPRSPNAFSSGLSWSRTRTSTATSTARWPADTLSLRLVGATHGAHARNIGEGVRTSCRRRDGLSRIFAGANCTNLRLPGGIRSRSDFLTADYYADIVGCWSGGIRSRVFRCPVGHAGSVWRGSWAYGAVRDSVREAGPDRGAHGHGGSDRRSGWGRRARRPITSRSTWRDCSRRWIT